MDGAVRSAQQSDLPAIRSLLTLVGLTIAGVGQQLDRFLVVEDAGQIVACAGLETYGSHTLLRSVAVHPDHRNRGLAALLVTRLVEQAGQDRLDAVYLLTTTAEAYFRRFGFDTILREDVDPSVQQSAEFGEGVCATARAMILPLAAATKVAKGQGGKDVMKYSVRKDSSSVKITVTQVGDKQADLMKELNECAEGRCSCPTPQYAKVQEMKVAPSVDQVIVTLTAKPGEVIDQADINKCLEHTTRKVQGQH